MAFVAGKSSTLKITDVGSTLRDFSTYASNINLSLNMDTTEVSAFTQAYKSQLAGQYGGTLSFDFIYDATFAGYLFALLAAGTASATEYCPAGSGAKYSFTAIVTGFNPSSSIGDAVKASVSMQITGAVTLA